jgi:hypothetical protein
VTYETVAEPNQPIWWYWGFDYERHKEGEEFYVPLWAPFLLAAAPAGFLWRGEVIARRRRRTGLCKTCGYSRASLAPDAKCPECGAGGSV